MEGESDLSRGLRSRRRGSRGAVGDGGESEVAPPLRLPPPRLSSRSPPHIVHALSAVPSQLTAFSLARTTSEPTWFRGWGAARSPPSSSSTKRARAKTCPPAPSPAVPHAFHATLALLSWSAASAALVFMNKRLLVDSGFSYPLALTGAGQLVSAAAAVAASRSGLWRGMTIGPMPRPLGSAVRALGPTVLCSAATLYFGNAAYLTLSLTFIQMLKVLMPAFTLTAASAAGLETPTVRLVFSVLLILAGSAVATAAEAGLDLGSLLSPRGLPLGGGGGRGGRSQASFGLLPTSLSWRSLLPSGTPPKKKKSSFSWIGFSSFVASAAFEAGRVVWMQALMANSGGSSGGGSSGGGSGGGSSSKKTRAEKKGKSDDGAKTPAAAAVIRKYNPAEVLAFLGPPTGLVLLAGSLLLEREGLLRSDTGLRAVARNPFTFASALLMGFAVNATTAAAIGATSSLTFKVFGCAKNVVVVLLGVAAGDTVSAPAAVGYAISMVGFAMYTAAKMVQEKEREKEKSVALSPTRGKRARTAAKRLM